MTSELRLSLNGDVDYLRLVWQAVEAMLEQAEFDEDPVQTRYNVLLSLQEAVSNVLRHGYQGGVDDAVWIEIRARLDDSSFRIELRDRCKPFDPTQVGELAEDVADDVTAIPEGGYGIHIIRAVLDRLDYERQGDENVLILEKRTAQPARIEG